MQERSHPSQSEAKQSFHIASEHDVPFFAELFEGEETPSEREAFFFRLNEWIRLSEDERSSSFHGIARWEGNRSFLHACWLSAN